MVKVLLFSARKIEMIFENVILEDEQIPLPSFSWSMEGCSSSGVAHLKIIFPDDLPHDVAILNAQV
jgi:hypothetical protein